MNLPLIARARLHQDNIAIVTDTGVFTYRDLLHTACQIATRLLDGVPDLQEQRVAFLIPSGFEYVATLWGIWLAGGIAVPLCVAHPRPELEYVITNSSTATIVAHPSFAEMLQPIARSLGLRFSLTSDALPDAIAPPLLSVDVSRRALILYTSGTTGKPKGVVTTHQNIQAQVTSLIEAWEWTAADRILHVLPLHHIHGIVNVLTCALWAGAQCHMQSRFDVDRVWQRIGDGDLTLFMAVPTIYVKLINYWQQATLERQQTMSAGCARMRLIVSGSAALPVRVLEQWQQVSGHFLLERYGMTEIGMALSNPLHGQRRAGFVGEPLPQVEVRLVDEGGELVPVGEPGEIQVCSPGVFLEYWQNSAATERAFGDRWFRTGDLAVVEDGSYRILGRMSVDIIKTGGYKVSALEIEEVLRTHPDIVECAVVGVEDLEWGERVCAAVVLPLDRQLTLESFRSWAKERLAAYKVPRELAIVAELPRNAMGKVVKPEVIELFGNFATSH